MDEKLNYNKNEEISAMLLKFSRKSSTEPITLNIFF